jgi:hypothetical protein
MVLFRWTAGAFDVTLTPPGGQLIDGAVSLIVNSGNPLVRLISDGANYFTV